MIGFTRRQEERLREIRAAYTIGDPRYCEPTPVHARLLFAKWLVASGRLNEGLLASLEGFDPPACRLEGSRNAV